MKHSIDELVGVVHRHYPRGRLSIDPRYEESEEYRRLVAARRQAGADKEPWGGLLNRLHARFPENIPQNRSLHLPTGEFDACYSAWLYLSTPPSKYNHMAGFMVSFLVPYYVVYSSRTVDDLEEIERMKALRAEPSPYVTVGHPDFPDTMFILPACIVKPEFIVPDSPEVHAYKTDISFDFSPDEQPYAAWIASEIEATWPGYERMPPEVGKVIVFEVSTRSRSFGEATLYDCLFSDNW